jgi:NodT family efflux transporter outer membrane factor (OMF) lipoprotein
VAVAVSAALVGCVAFDSPTVRAKATPVGELTPPGWLDGRADWPADGWWRGLGAPGLDRLIERALVDSPGVQVAAARLRAADAMAAQTRALRSPSLSASGEASEQRFSAHYLVPPQFAGRNLEAARVSLEAGYDFDLWGRQRAALEAAVGQASANRAELAQARLLLSTAIVQAWFGAVADLARLDRLQALAAERTLQRHLAERRAEVGLDATSVRQHALLAEQEVRLSIERLRQSLSLARNQLLALIGRGELDDDALTGDERRLDTALAGGDGLPVRLPLELVGRRPDLVAQLARIDAAAAMATAQRAEFYPSVDLASFVGLQAIGLGRLLSAGSRVSSVGPALRLPILDGGRLRAALAGREAELDAAVAQYNQLLVGAVREVADQLTVLTHLDQQSRLLQADLVSRRRLEDVAARRLAEGLDARQPLAEARVARLVDELAWIDLRAARAHARVALLRALGGGYVASDDSNP